MTDWKRLFAYDAWANRECLASLEAAAASLDRARQLLAHVVGSERLWLSRVEGQLPPPPPVWPALSLSECSAAIEEVQRRWTTFCDGATGETLSLPVAYTNSKGERWTSAASDILMHVVTHGGYHRGQIASELRSAGFTPAYTDYIDAVRRGRV